MKKNRKSIRQHFKDMGFKRFFSISLCLFLFPVLLLQVVYIRVSISNMNENVNEQVYNNLKQVSEKFKLKLESYKDMAYQIYSDKTLIQNLEEYGRVDFYMIREAQRNPKMEMMQKIQILWRPELVHIQEICGMAKYAEKSKEFVRKKIVERVPEEILNRLMSEELFERDYMEIEGRIREFRKGRRRGKRKD